MDTAAVSHGSAAARITFAGIVFVVALFFFTRNNGFWFDYHPDEGSKSGQIINGTRNYHHPLLMLNAADVAARIAGAAASSFSLGGLAGLRRIAVEADAFRRFSASHSGDRAGAHLACAASR